MRGDPRERARRTDPLQGIPYPTSLERVEPKGKEIRVRLETFRLAAHVLNEIEEVLLHLSNRSDRYLLVVGNTTVVSFQTLISVVNDSLKAA